jgi:uncharacterized protein (TIGR00255 family)
VAAREPKSALSMTGAGTCVVDVASGRFEAEARSVNHRFLKVSLHLGPALSSLEPAVEERVRGRVERGHVTVSLRYTRSSKAAAAAFHVDEEVAKAAAKRLTALAKACGIEGGVTMRDLLSVPGVLGDAGSDGLEAPVEKAATKALDGALEALVSSRATEGRHLAAECRGILARVSAVVERLGKKAPELPKAYRDRLAARLSTLLAGSDVAPDPAALAREVATFADRCDVTEELARLAGHLRHAEELLAAGGAVGRKLDFLVQEFHREANTLGSKSPDPDVTALVVELKADVERLREQVQNFE